MSEWHAWRNPGFSSQWKWWWSAFCFDLKPLGREVLLIFRIELGASCCFMHVTHEQSDWTLFRLSISRFRSSSHFRKRTGSFILIHAWSTWGKGLNSTLSSHWTRSFILFLAWSTCGKWLSPTLRSHLLSPSKQFAWHWRCESGSPLRKSRWCSVSTCHFSVWRVSSVWKTSWGLHTVR